MCRSPFHLSIFTHERRLRPRDRPRSSQRPNRYRCRTCARAPRRARKDSAAKCPKRFRQSHTRAAARHRITHCEHGRPQRPRLQNRRSASSMISQQAPATTAATALTVTNVLKSWSCCCCSPSCCSHHLQPKQRNPVAEHGRVDVSFSSSDRAGSRSKRCLPEVIRSLKVGGGRRT